MKPAFVVFVVLNIFFWTVAFYWLFKKNNKKNNQKKLSEKRKGKRKKN